MSNSSASASRARNTVPPFSYDIGLRHRSNIIGLRLASLEGLDISFLFSFHNNKRFGGLSVLYNLARRSVTSIHVVKQAQNALVGSVSPTTLHLVVRRPVSAYQASVYTVQTKKARAQNQSTRKK
jgi:hypothetical protein